jgi:hypothetical protein
MGVFSNVYNIMMIHSPPAVLVLFSRLSLAVTMAMLFTILIQGE